MFTNSGQKLDSTSAITFGAFNLNTLAGGKQSFKGWFQTSDPGADNLWNRFEISIDMTPSGSLSERRLRLGRSGFNLRHPHDRRWQMVGVSGRQ